MSDSDYGINYSLFIHSFRILETVYTLKVNQTFTLDILYCGISFLAIIYFFCPISYSL